MIHGPTATLAVVLWEDAAEVAHDDDDGKTVLAVRVGLVEKMDSRKIVLAGEVFEDGSCRDKIAIPRRMVKKLWTKKVKLWHSS